MKNISLTIFRISKRLSCVLWSHFRLDVYNYVYSYSFLIWDWVYAWRPFSWPVRPNKQWRLNKLFSLIRFALYTTFGLLIYIIFIFFCLNFCINKILVFCTRLSLMIDRLFSVLRRIGSISVIKRLAYQDNSDKSLATLGCFKALCRGESVKISLSSCCI